MPKTFFPELFEKIPASPPHPPDTEYKVSVGFEDWNGKFVPVGKVQMVYSGHVSGRRSPSFPVDSDDLDRVTRILRKLMKKANGN